MNATRHRASASVSSAASLRINTIFFAQADDWAAIGRVYLQLKIQIENGWSVSPAALSHGLDLADQASTESPIVEDGTVFDEAKLQEVLHRVDAGLCDVRIGLLISCGIEVC